MDSAVPHPTRVLVFGGQGMLGQAIARSFSSRWQVECVGSRDADVRRFSAVRDAVQVIQPEVVINAAAATAVDWCEQNRESAFQVNAWGARNVALASEGCRLVYIGSCGVFDNNRMMHDEYETPRPLSVYAESKYAGERLSVEHHRSVAVVRVGWLFGGDRGGRKNFVARRLEEAMASTEPIRSVVDRFGSPTWVDDACRGLEGILEADLKGVIHLSNEGIGSRFDYVQTVLRASGVERELVPASSSEMWRPAPVPVSEALISLNRGFAGLPLLRPWQEAVAMYVRQLMSDGRGVGATT